MKFIKFVIAVLLLPFVWSSVRILIDVIVSSDRSEIPWSSVICFGGGFLFWLLIYFSTSRLSSLYVFQHEATHALAVWTSGGNVSQFHVGQEGGHIISDRTSAWISLAPYILPLYPLISGLLWALCIWIYPASLEWTPYFLVFWGILWSFHISYTVSLLRTEQTDFSSQGYLFSWVVIALSNLWIITLSVWAWLTPYPLWRLVTVSAAWIRHTYTSVWGLIQEIVTIAAGSAVIPHGILD